MAVHCSITNFPECHCDDRDRRIQLLQSQLQRLQSERLTLKAANLLLGEQLADSTRELEARVASKEGEVQTLRVRCQAISSLVWQGEEKAAALQEELWKKEELLTVNSSFCWSSELFSDDELPGSPKLTNDICVQTSPRSSEVGRVLSGESLASGPLSARSDALPFSAEVQELRYTVQVLKEQLEEWQSVPNSPAHPVSPARWLPPPASATDVAVLRDTWGESTRLQDECPFIQCPIELSSIEPLALVDALAAPLAASEAMGRAAVRLEEECGRQALALYGTWYRARHQLHTAAVSQLTELEDMGRQQVADAEMSSWIALMAEQMERTLYMGSEESSVGEGFTYSCLLELPEHSGHKEKGLDALQLIKDERANPAVHEIWETEQWA
eukprot:EG_transcript_15961